MREFCFSDGDIDAALVRMGNEARAIGGKPITVSRFEHQWKALADTDGIEWFLHWFAAPTASLFDYLPPETLVVWDDIVGPARRIEETADNYERHRLRVPEVIAPFVSKPADLLLSPSLVEDGVACCDAVYCDTLDAPAGATPMPLSCTEQPVLPHEIAPLVEALRGRNAEGYRCVLLSPNIGHAERLQEILGDECPFIEIAIGFLDRGFIVRDIACSSSPKAGSWAPPSVR